MSTPPHPGTQPDRHWFEDVADHLGSAYLRYSFTKGTRQEVDFLVDELGLVDGMTVLDVGCGPGRHAVELARRGIRVVGVDISEEFIRVARELAADAGVGDLVEFVRGDARQLDFDGVADAAISLCQGAFGLGGNPLAGDPQNLGADSAVLSGMRQALRSRGRIAVSAFSSYFQVRYLEEQDQFAAASAVNHETTELIDGAGVKVGSELWTTCYTPRELRMLAERCGLVVENIYSVIPGGYRREEPNIDTYEFLLIAGRG
ncbi:MAG: class I SAM-dependent methyltransferase [Microthrixaceae bacterium]